MSASLVGSEMCIRDRVAALERSHMMAAGNTSRLRVGDEADSMCEIGLDPVSYTHLTLPTICSV
eukprot:12681177-Alexandrium_andersonii.AAC.1